jgi:competence protein ComEC
MPLFWVSLAFVAGILAGRLVGLPAWAWLLLGGFFVFFGLLVTWLGRHLPAGQRVAVRLPTLFWLMLFVAALGAAYFQFVQPAFTPDFIAWYNDSNPDIIVEGVIVDPPDIRDAYTNLRVQVEQLRPETDLVFRPVVGLLLVSIYDPGHWAYGDRLRLEGRLETPPENEQFSYRDYLAHQGIYSQMRGPRVNVIGHGQGSPFLAAIYALRDHALSMVYTLWPDPEASLLAGILLGVESGIPADVKEAFAATGTSHIIAFSGFNIVTVGTLFGRWREALLALHAVGLYAVFVGGEPAMFRAAILGELALFAALDGRNLLRTDRDGWVEEERWENTAVIGSCLPNSEVILSRRSPWRSRSSIRPRPLCPRSLRLPRQRRRLHNLMVSSFL